ncbi:tetratricopeptide repeat protein [Rhizodiscina lignyota]|uniref:ER membrane protein complex subunit 2 n=1 Tax=Rhizodiscina lignyota TaxID=1504668 RepID=A0A9P4IBP9_9PEZI|nr:tetratricopeptide repeat protein [Rhizodiscina lignyota]
MSADLIQPFPSISPSTAVHLSQQAPQILQSSSSLSLPYPLSLLTSTETQETWMTYENLLISCLRTGDNEAARRCLDELLSRFGEKNERVMALQGMYEEAVAENDKELGAVMQSYEAVLKEDPTNMPIRKRRVALLRSMGKTNDATAALVELLDASPTDSEAWAELADLYFTQGLYSQAIYSLEEVLLIIPNAWNIHARLGEIAYISATSSESSDRGNTAKVLSDALRRFCRSIELCDNYLRGYYGLKITAKKLLDALPRGGKGAIATSDGDLPPPPVETVEKLHEIATSKLAEIVRRGSAGEKGWEGYDEAELIAARALLDKDEEKVER